MLMNCGAGMVGGSRPITVLQQFLLKDHIYSYHVIARKIK